MKKTNWVKIVLGILLAVIVLAAVGGLGFRLGVTQSVKFTTGVAMPFAHMRGFDGDFARGFAHGHHFGGRGNFGWGGDFGGFGGFGLFGFGFGLLRLAVLAGLVWIGYTFFKRSGWRLVKDEAAATSTPAASQTVVEDSPSAEGDEKQDSA